MLESIFLSIKDTRLTSENIINLRGIVFSNLIVALLDIEKIMVRGPPNACPGT